jgi:hypothetical protein
MSAKHVWPDAPPKIYGRKILEPETQIPLEFDDVVIEIGGNQLVLSLYTCRVSGRVELRSNTGTLVVRPCASNSIEIESRRGR